MAKKDRKKKMKREYFHTWSINISDEEVRIIHKSGGLIGFMMDKGLLGGPQLLDEIKQMKSKEEQKMAFLKLIWSNIFQMVKAVGEPSAWDILAMGTDYDGLIAHVDCYDTSASIKDLYRDLIDFLTETKFKRDLWFDYSPKQIVDKIMRENSMEFLRKHFH